MVSFTQCGMRYRLERRDGITETPAWALVAGRAFHETIREWETAAAGDVVPSADAAAERFPHHLAEEIAETVIKTGIGPHDWRASGRSSQAYPDKENRAWWLDKGPEMVAQYVLAQAGRESETLRLVDGETLALELGFTLRLDGLPEIKGFIDQVLYFPRTDQILVRDYKSGAQVPVDRLQLQMYRLAIEDCFGITARAIWGDYWDARKGKATRGYDLSNRGVAEAAVRYRVTVMDLAEQQGLYAPNPGNNCSACGVRPHCPAMSDESHATWRRPNIGA